MLVIISLVSSENLCKTRYRGESEMSGQRDKSVARFLFLPGRQVIFYKVLDTYSRLLRAFDLFVNRYIQNA